MRAQITINGKTYRSADYDSNVNGNGLWCDGKQTAGTCDIHPTERTLKHMARVDLIEKLGAHDIIETRINDSYEYEAVGKFRVKYIF